MSSTGKKMETRRGTRVPCEISAALSSMAAVPSTSEPCLIVLVNPQGCAVRFRRKLEVGTPVHLHNLPAASKVTARVVNCIAMGEHEHFWLLGLALERPGNIWGISDPPQDWD